MAVAYPDAGIGYLRAPVNESREFSEISAAVLGDPTLVALFVARQFLAATSLSPGRTAAI